jgi:hypothetical protein
MSFSRPVTTVEPSFPWARYTWDNNGYFDQQYNTAPSDGNPNGVSFAGQDQLCLTKQGTNDCGQIAPPRIPIAGPEATLS